MHHRPRYIKTEKRPYPGTAHSSQIIYGLVLLSFFIYAYLPSLRLSASPTTLRVVYPAMSSPRPTLEAAIAEAAASGATHLDLSNRGLRALPPSIGALTRLESLNLAGNELEDLPEELAQLTALRTLFFLGNRFTRIPPVVGRLPSLYMLSFKSNALAAIDEGALPPSLGWLILTDNKLTALPASLGRLANLRKLMLASNQLSALPDMGGLAALELVRLSDNRLREVPPGLLALPRLAWVALAGNHLPPLTRDSAWTALAEAPAGVQAKDLEMGAQLGNGASGTVFAAARPGGAGPVALKVFKAASSDGRPVDEVRARGAPPPSPSPTPTKAKHALPLLHTRTLSLTRALRGRR